MGQRLNTNGPGFYHMLKRITLSDGEAFAATPIPVTKLVDPNQMAECLIKLLCILIDLVNFWHGGRLEISGS